MTAPFLGSSSDVSPKRLRGPSYTRLSRDLYVIGDAALDLRTRIDAALLLFPEAVVCLETGAALLGLPVDDDEIVHLDGGKRAVQTERSGIQLHRLGIPAERRFEAKGISVADGPRLVADLSARLTLEGLVALGDQVLRRWPAEDLSAAVRAHGSRRGAVLLRQAVPLMDKGADAPTETRMRLRMHAAGFTALRHGVVVKDVDGGWLGQPDLADEVAKIALQYEGVEHFAKGVEQRRHDLDRDEVVKAVGWEVVAATALDDRRPQRLVERLTRAYFRQAQLLGPHVLPPHLR
jgi:hypothetical protein